MADRGILSKRRWAQWLGYIGGVVGAVVAVAPQLAPVVATFVAPDKVAAVQASAAALAIVSGELARRSKNADTQTAQPAIPAGND